MHLFIYFTLIISLFSGCSVTSPSITHYTLHPVHSTQTEQGIHTAKTLKIITTETLSSLNTKSIYYTHNSEHGAYLYGRWSDTPSLMLNRLLRSSLESENIFSVVMNVSSNAQSDWILESDILAFDHEFMPNNTSRGLIDLSCRLIDVKTAQPIAAKRFTIISEAQSNDLKGGVAALQKSSEELTRQQTMWLKSIVKNIK